MLFGITFLALFCSLNGFFLKDEEHIFQDVDLNSSLSKSVDFEHNPDIFGSDSCSCRNGRCVKDNRGKWRCMCQPKHSLQGKDCELCDCGKKGTCIFTETFSEQTRKIQYEKKCVCDTGYADRYGTCTECVCGVNSKCEFEYGEKNCYCMEGYVELNGVCTECNCGDGGYCEFHRGQKICTCFNGYLFDGHICREGCSENDDCEVNQKCVEESDDWKTCQCADGLSGSNCEELEWCEDTGRFSNCKGVNGSCEYVKEKRSVYCICASGKNLHPEEKRCRDTCTSNDDCKIGGTCENNFCTCKSGLVGDKCETIFDCTTEGKYKGCEIGGGNCTHDGRRAVCECPVNKKYHDTEHTCKECNCGSNGDCRFENGWKKCECYPGFALKDGICKATCSEDMDCTENQKCSIKANWKSCICADGLSGDNCEENDWCKEYGLFEDCKGINGTCAYDKEKRSVDCKCDTGKEVYPFERRCKTTCNNVEDCNNRGECEKNFCTCNKGVIGDKCETILDCRSEGKYRGCASTGGNCTHDGTNAVCICPVNQKYHHTEHICKATCTKNGDCNDKQKCVDKDGWMTCVCADGLSGDSCEKNDWCEGTGKFKNCKGDNGTCQYVKDKRSVDCTCAGGKALDAVENRCRDTCFSNDDCMNGGTCEGNFCSCNSGLMGDRCETVFDCTFYGKYKDCEISGGKCYYEASKAVCECSENKILHNKELVCKDCHCGDHGSCAFEYEEKICLCNKGYSEKNGKCESCDCGENGYCSFQGDKKVCKCDVRYSENSGKCESCDCGDGGWCSFINGEKTCECGDGYSEQDGKCEICDCGIRGLCYFVGGEKLCKCKGGYAEKNGRCEVCSCAKNTVCKFIYGAKACLCLEGYTFNDETGECEECDCGSHGSCAFLNGEKTCICEKGFKEHLGECKDVCDLNPCKNQGTCYREGYSFKCKCTGNWIGDTCNKRLRPCEPNPCVNGHCVVREDDFLCLCDDPFTGRFCEISSCIETKCIGGRCRVIGNREECMCPVGHKLRNGTCTKTYCVEKKCYDGECVIENGIETCICREGYVSEGNECRKVKCSERSCIGGACRIIRGNIEECVCPMGHVLIGDTCTITTCTPRTCYGGRCEKRDGELVCICPDGFHLEGVGCIETTCKEQNCFGGKCRVINGKEICTCLDGHVLKNDQCQKMRCVEKHCFGGKCDVVDGEEVCSCPVGFEVQGDVCREIQHH